MKKADIKAFFSSIKIGRMPGDGARAAVIAALVVVALVPMFMLGVMGMVECDCAAPAAVGVTLSGVSVAGVQGGYVRYTTFARARSPFVDPLELAANAPVWGAYCGGTAKIYAAGSADVELEAAAVASDGTRTSLPTAGNAIVLPDEKGSYTIDVTVHMEEGDVQYAFRVSVVPNAWTGSKVA